MYARLVRFSLGPGSGGKALEFAEELGKLIVAQPGCKGVTVFGDDGDGEHGIFVLWDSADHANAAAPLVRPQLDKHLAGSIETPPDARLFPVIWSA